MKTSKISYGISKAVGDFFNLFFIPYSIIMTKQYEETGHYRSLLDLRSTQKAIQLAKRSFEKQLEHFLSLEKTEAPLFVTTESGLNDALTGEEKAVSFEMKALPELRAEVVHSLAKWKRMALGKYNYLP